MELSESQSAPSPSVLERIQKLMASPPVSWRTLHKGYTAAETWIMAFESGKSAFVKHATDEQTASWLKSERSVYEAVQGERGRHNFGLRVPGVNAFTLTGFLASAGALDPDRTAAAVLGLRDETTQSAAWVSLAALRLK